jgi:hypothetical protein
MMEILSESVRLVNLPFTVLLGCVVLYWLLMGLGLVHFETGADVDVDADADVQVDTGLDLHSDADLDIHADTDIDAHVDADADADAHVEGGAEPGLFASVFQFLNIGEVPLMVVLSIMTLCLWLGSMILNHYWGDASLMRGAMLLVPNLVLSCILTHLVTRPLRSFFRALNREYDEHLPIVGRTCRVLTGEANSEFGQAQIETKGAPILINVRTTGDAVLKKGETGLVVKADKATSIYTIVKVTADKLET